MSDGLEDEIDFPSQAERTYTIKREAASVAIRGDKWFA